MSYADKMAEKYVKEQKKAYLKAHKTTKRKRKAKTKK